MSANNHHAISAIQIAVQDCTTYIRQAIKVYQECLAGAHLKEWSTVDHALRSDTRANLLNSPLDSEVILRSELNDLISICENFELDERHLQYVETQVNSYAGFLNKNPIMVKVFVNASPNFEKTLASLVFDLEDRIKLLCSLVFHLNDTAMTMTRRLSQEILESNV